MTKAAKMSGFTGTVSQKETPMDKTTRIVRKIIDDEATKRLKKTERLRKARVESAADEAVETIKPAPKKVRKKK